MHLYIKKHYFETGVPLEENKKYSACGDDIYADISGVAPFTIDLYNM
jgi:hypothetical protein